MRAKEKRRIWEEARGHLGCGNNKGREQGAVGVFSDGKIGMARKWGCQDGNVAEDGGGEGEMGNKLMVPEHKC